MSNLVAFIGDIHGQPGPLEDILSKVGDTVSTIVFLGDYINRGPDSKRVLDTLVELRRAAPQEIVLIGGNHDRQFQRVLEGDGELADFLRMGGAPTIRSYVRPPYRDVQRQLQEAVPDEHRRLLDSMVESWVGDGVFACHAARDAGEVGDRFLVAGHDLQPQVKPSITARRALIDTGCGTLAHGRLTCLLWPSLHWVQSDQL